MAKTSLIHNLQRAYHIAKFAAQQGVSSQTAIEMWDMRISRRHLLQGSVALAFAGGALNSENRPSNAQSSSRQTPVLIVGAGIAGLTAAYYLNRAGIAVRIVEANKRLGGRIFSQEQALGTEITVELGGEFIDSGHKNIRKLVRELGLAEVDLFAGDRGLTKDLWYFNDRLVQEQELVTAFAPLAKQIDRDAKAIGEVNYKYVTPRARVLDRLSIRDYLTRYCKNPTLRKFIEVAYTNEYGLDIGRQSSINLLLLIGKSSSKIEIFGSSDQRYQIRGGNQNIINKLIEKLGDRIETNTSLESLRATTGGRYRVSLHQGGSSSEHIFDRVILALPFSILRQVDLGVNLPLLKQKAIRELGYGTNAKLLTSYSDRSWRNKYKSNGQSFSDLVTSETWEATRYSADKQGIITSFSGGSLGSKIGRAQPALTGREFSRQFDQIYPGVQGQYLDRAITSDWIDSKYSRGSYACYLVGQWTKFAGVEGKRVGNLFFIGEHCSIEAQGYMEGGCGTGVMAANTILKDLKLDTQVFQQ
jgi:monoamine oxidase